MNIQLFNTTASTCVSILLVVGFTGCMGHSENLKEAQATTTDFFLGPEDVLEITVWRNQDLSRQTVVRPDGMVSMPLIGDVQASGLTANQLAARIGTVREVVTRVLFRLQQQGLISVTGKTILLPDTTALAGYAETAI